MLRRPFYDRFVAAEPEPNLPGRWLPARGASGSDAGLQEEIERLEAIGYLAGSKPAPSASGVTVDDAARAFPGLNLYTSGHAPEALLMTMNGRILHRWAYEFADAWPDYRRRPADHPDNFEYWRRVHLFDNGDLLAIFEGHGMVMLDRDSHLLWSFSENPHHDISVAPDGSIYVLTRRARRIERINPDRPVLEDFVTILDPKGAVLRQISILEALERSRYSGAVALRAAGGDIFHTNTLELLDGRLAALSPKFAAGNALISMRDLNMIAIVDLGAEEVVWASIGIWVKQHQPTLLDDGRILLFDNLGRAGHSRVIELDPETGTVVWSYGERSGEELDSECCGSAQRLPNGNTLISETDRGRALEVTRGGEIVWEFVNPERRGADRELIAILPELVRIPGVETFDWIDVDSSGAIQ